MTRLMDLKDVLNEEKMMDFRYATLEKLVNHETRRKITKNDIIPPPRIRKKALHFGLQDGEILELL